MLYASKFSRRWQPRHSCVAVLPSSHSSYFWSINVDHKFSWNFCVEVRHKGSRFKRHPVYQARFWLPPSHSGSECCWSFIYPLVLASIWKFHDLWCIPLYWTQHPTLLWTWPAHYFRHILHAKKLLVVQRGEHRSMSTPQNIPLCLSL